MFGYRISTVWLYIISWTLLAAFACDQNAINSCGGSESAEGTGFFAPLSDGRSIYPWSIPGTFCDTVSFVFWDKELVNFDDDSTCDASVYKDCWTFNMELPTPLFAGRVYNPGTKLNHMPTAQLYLTSGTITVSKYQWLDHEVACDENSYIILRFNNASMAEFSGPPTPESLVPTGNVINGEVNFRFGGFSDSSDEWDSLCGPPDVAEGNSEWTDSVMRLQQSPHAIYQTPYTYAGTENNLVELDIFVGGHPLMTNGDNVVFYSEPDNSPNGNAVCGLGYDPVETGLPIETCSHAAAAIVEETGTLTSLRNQWALPMNMKTAGDKTQLPVITEIESVHDYDEPLFVSWTTPLIAGLNTDIIALRLYDEFGTVLFDEEVANTGGYTISPDNWYADEGEITVEVDLMETLTPPTPLKEGSRLTAHYNTWTAISLTKNSGGSSWEFLEPQTLSDGWTLPELISTNADGPDEILSFTACADDSGTISVVWASAIFNLGLQLHHRRLNTTSMEWSDATTISLPAAMPPELFSYCRDGAMLVWYPTNTNVANWQMNTVLIHADETITTNQITGLPQLPVNASAGMTLLSDGTRVLAMMGADQNLYAYINEKLTALTTDAGGNTAGQLHVFAREDDMVDVLYRRNEGDYVLHVFDPLELQPSQTLETKLGMPGTCGGSIRPAGTAKLLTLCGSPYSLELVSLFTGQYLLDGEEFAFGYEDDIADIADAQIASNWDGSDFAVLLTMDCAFGYCPLLFEREDFESWTEPRQVGYANGETLLVLDADSRTHIFYKDDCNAGACLLRHTAAEVIQ